MEGAGEHKDAHCHSRGQSMEKQGSNRIGVEISEERARTSSSDAESFDAVDRPQSKSSGRRPRTYRTHMQRQQDLHYLAELNRSVLSQSGEHPGREEQGDDMPAMLTVAEQTTTRKRRTDKQSADGMDVEALSLPRSYRIPMNNGEPQHDAVDVKLLANSFGQKSSGLSKVEVESQKKRKKSAHSEDGFGIKEGQRLTVLLEIACRHDALLTINDVALVWASNVEAEVGMQCISIGGTRMWVAATELISFKRVAGDRPTVELSIRVNATQSSTNGSTRIRVDLTIDSMRFIIHTLPLRILNDHTFRTERKFERLRPVEDVAEQRSAFASASELEVTKARAAVVGDDDKAPSQDTPSDIGQEREARQQPRAHTTMARAPPVRGKRVCALCEGGSGSIAWSGQMHLVPHKMDSGWFRHVELVQSLRVNDEGRMEAFGNRCKEFQRNLRRHFEMLVAMPSVDSALLTRLRDTICDPSQTVYFYKPRHPLLELLRGIRRGGTLYSVGSDNMLRCHEMGPDVQESGFAHMSSTERDYYEASPNSCWRYMEGDEDVDVMFVVCALRGYCIREAEGHNSIWRTALGEEPHTIVHPDGCLSVLRRDLIIPLWVLLYRARESEGSLNASADLSSELAGDGRGPSRVVAGAMESLSMVTERESREIDAGQRAALKRKRQHSSNSEQCSKRQRHKDVN